jgi:hypothetical protein
MELGKLTLEARNRAKDMYPEVKIFDHYTYQLACDYVEKRDIFVKQFLLGCEYMLEQLKKKEYEGAIDKF